MLLMPGCGALATTERSEVSRDPLHVSTASVIDPSEGEEALDSRRGEVTQCTLVVANAFTRTDRSELVERELLDRRTPPFDHCQHQTVSDRSREEGLVSEPHVIRRDRRDGHPAVETGATYERFLLHSRAHVLHPRWCDVGSITDDLGASPYEAPELIEEQQSVIDRSGEACQMPPATRWILKTPKRVSYLPYMYEIRTSPMSAPNPALAAPITHVIERKSSRPRLMTMLPVRRSTYSRKTDRVSGLPRTYVKRTGAPIVRYQAIPLWAAVGRQELLRTAQ